MSDVFISYSRKDLEFVRTLNKALERRKRKTWVDWEGIPKGTEWWKEIEEGIEWADTFVFVISPDSVASTVCQDEINHAVKYNKRILPIVYKEPDQNFYKSENPSHKAVRSHNFLFFPNVEQDTDDFKKSFKELIDALDLDIPYVKGHTRLLVRALEWKELKSDDRFIQDDYLLRGSNLKDAEKWINEGSNKKPQPTELHNIFIKKSRKIEDKNQQDLEQLKQEKTKIEGLIAVAEIKLEAKEAKNLWFEGPTAMDCLLIALKAGHKLQNCLKQNISISNPDQWQTKLVLFQILQTVKEENRLTRHQGAVLSVSFSPDGKILATGGSNVKLWDAATGKEIRTITGDQGGVWGLSFSPDSKTLATSGDDKTVRLWDVATGKELQTLTGHEREIYCVSFSPDGKTLASASDDHTVKLWDVATGQELQTLTGHSFNVRSVNYSPDGKTLVTASIDHTVKLWKVKTGKVRKTLSGHNGWVYIASYSSDGTMLATGSADKTVKLWDTATGEEIQTFEGHRGEVWGLSFSPDGTTLATGSWDTTVKLWDVYTGEELYTLKGHQLRIWRVSFSPDGKTLATASDDRTVRLWDMATGEELQVFTVDQESVNSAEISPDDKTLFSTTGDDGQIVTLRDVATGEELTLTGHKWKVVCKSFSSDGKTLATGSYDNTARLWDVATGKELQILSEHGGSVSGVSFSPDGKILATVSYDQTAKLWDVATGKELHTLRGHRGWIYHVSFSPDGKTLVTGGNNDKTVRLWDVDTGKDLYTSTELPVDEITGVRFSPDGQTLIVNTKWNGDILWDFGLDKLMQKGCEWIGNYLSNHPEETELQQICQPYLSGKSNPKP